MSSNDGLVGVSMDQLVDPLLHAEQLISAAIQARFPLTESVFPTPYRYGDENTLENTRLTLPQFLENIVESGAGLRCPLAIIGCNCYSDRPTPPTLGLPRTTVRRDPRGTAHPYEIYLPVAPQQEEQVPPGAPQQEEQVLPAQTSMVPPEAPPVQVPPPAAAQPQNQTGVSASVPGHIQASNSASQALGASTSQKRKRSEDKKTPDDPRSKRPALDTSVQSAPWSTGFSAPRHNRIRVSAAALPPLDAQDRESSLSGVVRLSSFDAMMQGWGSDNRRDQAAASASAPGHHGIGGAFHTSTPISVLEPTYNQEHNLPSTYPSSAYPSRTSGVVEDYFNQNHKRPQASEPSGEPEAKRPVRSRGATPSPNMVAQQTASRLEDPSQASNARNSPLGNRRQLTPITRNQAQKGPFDKDRCRSCLGLDGENGHPIGAMICCSNEQTHGTDDHWYHFRCVGLDVTPAEDEQWYCWECKAEAGSASDRVSSSVSSTEDGSDDKDESDNDDGSDDDGTAPRKMPLNRTYAPSATGTLPGQAATNRNPKGANWSDVEKGYVATLMHEVMQDESISKTEKRWVKAGDLLQERYGVTRTATAIKNYWNREGRNASGLDERNKKNPNKLVTGVQAPADRKAQREAKKNNAKKAGRTTQQDIEEEINGEEEVYQPTTKPTKRPRLIGEESDGEDEDMPYVPYKPTAKLTMPIKSTKRPRLLGDESDDEDDVYENVQTIKRQRRHP